MTRRTSLRRERGREGEASAITLSPARLAAKRVCEQQLGFVKGRQLMEAILAVESAPLGYSHCSPDGDPGGACLDSSVASLGIALEWMVKMLVGMGASAWFRTGVAECNRLLDAEPA